MKNMFVYDRFYGEKIAEIRNSKNLTQEQLAAKFQLLGLDFTRSTIGMIEIGKRKIIAEELSYFAKAFDMDEIEFYKLLINK